VKSDARTFPVIQGIFLTHMVPQDYLRLRTASEEGLYEQIHIEATGSLVNDDLVTFGGQRLIRGNWNRIEDMMFYLRKLMCRVESCS
jgi:hypothetical protein